MLNNLPLFARRLLALAILLGILGVLGSVTLLPILNRSAEYDESIADLGFQLQRYLRLVDEEAPLKSQLNRLTAQRTTGKGLLDGESDAIAAASLQAEFKQWVQEAGGRLESTQILSNSANGIMDRIGIRAQFSGDIEALQQVLHDIEFGDSILFVDRIEIRSKRVRRRARQATPSADTLLQVSLEISGYRRGEEQRQ